MDFPEIGPLERIRIEFAEFTLLVGGPAPRHDVLSPSLAVSSELKVFNYYRNWTLLRTWHLSDERTELLINDRLSFLGLSLLDRLPDARTI